MTEIQIVKSAIIVNVFMCSVPMDSLTVSIAKGFRASQSFISSFSQTLDGTLNITGR